MTTNTNLHLIGCIARGDGQEIRVCLTEYRGRKKLDIRSWYRLDGQEEMVATKRGVAISYEDLEQFSALLDEAREAINAESERISW